MLLSHKIFAGLFVCLFIIGRPHVFCQTTLHTNTPSRPLDNDTTLKQGKYGFWQRASQPDKGRIIGISTFAGVSYTTSMVILSKAWYAQYPQTKFHFFNDNAGWSQIDKAGHVWTAYMESNYSGELYRWAGVSPSRSAWIGAGVGLAFQSGIEVLDGFSDGWGASVGDIVANSTGAALYLGQALAWGEQRVLLKFSAHKVDYSQQPEEVQNRAAELYGTQFSETLLKDYNGQSYWLSVCPAAFSRREQPHWPRYLNIAVGYGAENMFGAERNIWKDENGVSLNYSDIVRYRQYFLSLDLDLRHLPIRSPFLRTLLGALNVFKMPAPAIEVNSRGKFKWHWLYF